MRRFAQSCVRPTVLVLLLVTWYLAPVSPALADAAEPGKRIALVIGNAGYTSVSRLANPGNDARLIAETARKLGFTLVGGGAQIDLDKQHFDQMLQRFGQEIVGADVALLYYSGHGLQVRGTNWLVPIDANPAREQDLDFQMVSADVVLHQMQGAGTRLNILILDACRNNPFAGRGLRAATGGLAEMHAPEGTLISYATQPGNVALDGSGADSPFAAALAKSMVQPGHDIFRTFNAVGVAVKKQTGGAQEPWLASSPIEGDFYFAGSGAPTAAAAEPAAQSPRPAPPPPVAPVVQPAAPIAPPVTPPPPAPTQTAMAQPRLPATNFGDELTDFRVPPQAWLQASLASATPLTIPGGRTVTTWQLAAALKNGLPLILIDALAAPHMTIPGSHWLSYAGAYGFPADVTDRRLQADLSSLTGGNRDAKLVFFCQGARCWESYNAALRALRLGYHNVFWYRGGIVAWGAAGGPMVQAR